MMMRVRRTFALLVLLGSPGIVGCGNGLAKVSGTVTLDGKPIQGGPQMYATVNFVREDGRGTASVGIIDASGHYTLRMGAQEGIQPGPYLVGIAAQKVTPPATPEGMPQATLVTPAKYADITQSGFREEVKAGRNTFDFALSSTGKK
jgi:hypothetical protein